MPSRSVADRSARLRSLTGTEIVWWREVIVKADIIPDFDCAPHNIVQPVTAVRPQARAVSV